MAGQILHVGGRIVAEAVAPGQMDADIRAAQFAVQVSVAAEQRHIAELGALVHTFKVEVCRNDLISAIQGIFDHMAADIPGRAGDKNRFHSCSSLMVSKSYRFCSRSWYKSSAAVCFLLFPASCKMSSIPPG